MQWTKDVIIIFFILRSSKWLPILGIQLLVEEEVAWEGVEEAMVEVHGWMEEEDGEVMGDQEDMEMEVMEEVSLSHFIS